MPRISHAVTRVTTMMVSVLHRIHKGRAVDPESRESATGTGTPKTERPRLRYEAGAFG
jgi:hypothetical protein